MRRLDGITNSMDMNLSKFQEIVEDRGNWHAIVHVVTKSRTPFHNLTAKMTTPVTVNQAFFNKSIR